MYAFGTAGSLHYIILEFIAENTLSDLLAEETPVLPIWKCLRIGRDIANGLHAAHQIGIVHHRLTPSNIVVSRDGYSRVLDLGAAQGTIDALAQKPWSFAMDSSLFFAPEQIEFGISEPHSDQYRIGAILYQVLAGRPAYPDSGEAGAFSRLETDPVPVASCNPEIPVELNDIVMKALSRNPENRYRDCHELATQLESLDPDIWLPDLEPAFQSSTDEAKVALLLAEIKRNEKNREYYRAMALCEQALALAPYNSEVTTSMLRVQQLHEREQEIRSLVHKAIIAFYSSNLTDSLKTLKQGLEIDKNNAELLRLTHEIMQEQERHRLISALIDAAKIDLAKQALSSAMSQVVRILDIDPGNETALKLKQRIEFGMEDRATIGMLVSRAEAAFNSDRLDEAEEMIRKIFHMDPNNFHARKLNDRIERLKKHRLLMTLWENLDLEVKKENYREAISILKHIAHLEPSLKSEIRARLIRMREKITETSNDLVQGETRPLRAVKPEDLSQSETDSDVLPDEQDDGNVLLEKTPAGISVAVRERLEKTVDVSVEEAGTGSSHQTAVGSGIEPEPDEPEFSDECIDGDTGVELTPIFIPGIPKTGLRNRLFRNRIIVFGACMVFVIFAVIGLRACRSEEPAAIPPVPTREPEPAHDTNITTIHATATPVPTPSATIPPTPAATTVSTPEPTPSPGPGDSSRDETIRQLMSNARSNERGGNIDMARVFYQEVLRIDRAHPEALQGLRNLEWQQRQRDRRPTPEKVESVKPPAATPARTATPSEVPQTSARIVQISNAIVRCDPAIPRRGQKLDVEIRFPEPLESEITHLWLNYRRSDTMGYSQIFASRDGSTFNVTLPAHDVKGTAIMYFLNGLRSDGAEFYYGDPDRPKLLP